MKTTKEKEHYIKEIYKLIENNKKVSVSSLSFTLGVSKSSVTNMLKILVKMQLVDNADQVHEIAEELEHINSPVFFRKVKKMLGQKKIDPHGSSIPEIDF